MVQKTVVTEETTDFVMDFKTSSAEGNVDFINVFDLEKMAQQVILKEPLDILQVVLVIPLPSTKIFVLLTTN